MIKLHNSNAAIAARVSVITISCNAVLFLFKLLAGIIGRSGALVSDAVDSATDVFSAIIVSIGVQLSGKKSDQSHQYGHERMECISAIMLAFILGMTGAAIGYSGIVAIVTGLKSGSQQLPVPSLLPLIAAITSILAKEAMALYTKKAAKKIKSGSLLANAKNYQCDVFSSVGSLIGIAGARLGFPLLDPIVSVVICAMIIKVAFETANDAINKLVDKSCDESTVDEIRKLILSQDGVLGVDLIKTRLFGSKFYVEVEIEADGAQTLTCAHAIAEDVHNLIEVAFPDAKHCTVHVNPAFVDVDRI